LAIQHGFLSSLKQAGLNLIEHAFPDHHQFTASDLSFQDDLPILMTEKDAVKCRGFPAELTHKAWYLPIEAHLDAVFAEKIMRRLKELAHG